MAAVAEDMRAKLRAEPLEVVTGAVPTFFLAGIGFAGSAPITGLCNWPSLLAGTAAVAAARRHALLLAEADEP